MSAALHRRFVRVAFSLAWVIALWCCVCCPSALLGEQAPGAVFDVDDASGLAPAAESESPADAEAPTQEFESDAGAAMSDEPAPDADAEDPAAEEAPLPDEEMSAEEPEAEAQDEAAAADEQAETTDEEEPEGELYPAAMQSVRPGQTTRAALHAAWGNPQRTEKIAGGTREYFTVADLGRTRVTVGEELVESLTVQLDTPVMSDTLIERLQLSKFEPVQIFNADGQLLGQAFPERGVLFGLALDSTVPRVMQIVIEQIDPQPFLARAEQRMATRYTDCLSDLQTALRLVPDYAQAHWLHAELALAAGDLEQSLPSARRAVELEPTIPEFRLTLAKVQAANGDHAAAIEIARTLAESPKTPGLVMARAYCLWGDSLVLSTARDYPQAIKHHQKAIKLATPLSSSKKTSIRRAAKELLVDANLAVARDIGWGRWQQKSKVVPKWVDRAVAVVDDIENKEVGSPELRLRIYEQALAAAAGIADPPDCEAWERALAQHGKQILDAAQDAAYRAKISWRMGVALADAVEIEAARHVLRRSEELGDAALDYLQQGEDAGKQLPTHDAIRGRLCYRLGALFAIERSDHRRAIAWFDRAVPLLESPMPAAVIDSGRLGETFVSMAVSFWEVNRREEALRLTNQGVKLMEVAAEDGLMAKSSLAVPYGNLASMYEQLGNPQDAQRFAELATRYAEGPAR